MKAQLGENKLERNSKVAVVMEEVVVSPLGLFLHQIKKLFRQPENGSLNI